MVSSRWLSILAAMLAGCGPIGYLSMVSSQASKSVAEARTANAAELAPYEYTAAVEYLHKAREVGGYARYQEAFEWGKKARNFADKALDIARRRGRLDDAPPLTPKEDRSSNRE